MSWSVTTLLMSFGGGALLGVVYFIGLWWTARATPSAQRPGLLLFLSFLGRIVLLLGGLYGLIGGDPIRLLAALIGIYLGRRVTTRFIAGKGDSHAGS